MKKNTIILFTIIIITVIAITGMIVGVKTLKNSAKQSENLSKDVLIYTLKESRKVTFYQTHLNKILPQAFYKLSDNEANFYLASVVDNKITVEMAGTFGNPKGIKYTIGLDGKKSEETTNELLVGMVAKSADGRITAEGGDFQNNDAKIVITGAGRSIEIPASDFAHNFNRLTPLLFSSDNRYLYVLASVFTGDIGSPNGLYKVNIVGDLRGVDQIFYSGEIENGANKEGFPISTFLDPTGTYAYILEGYETERKFVQKDLNNGTEKIIIPSMDNLDFNLFSNNKFLVTHPLDGQSVNINIFNTTTGIEKKIHVSGGFSALSSDENYLIYTKYSETLSDTPFTNANPINGSNRKIQTTEYHVYDVKANNDSVLFANRMIPNNQGSPVPVDGKEYSFVGLISSESK